MKFYVAEIVGLLVDLLCALTNHAHGCWVSNHGLSKLRDWSLNVVNPPRDPAPGDPFEGVWVPYCATDPVTFTGNLNTTTTVARWPSC